MKHVLSNDEALQRAVMAELSAAGMPAGRVGAIAQAGIVTLLGHVQHADEKHRAEAATLRLKEVKAVVVAVEIRAAGTARLRDDEIAAQALTRLAWDAWVPQNALKVKVEHGWITLVGQLDRGEQKAAALEDVSRLFGVAGVSDHTTLKAGGAAQGRHGKRV
ncbi:BON domain-containing protein [Paraburkholderia phenazinium]|uniref:BON domain-containing protein n=1 Tax=Paraburkholderia phenazinium TaxID=60549 RepID=A0A1N6KQC4_9BURK|nr:BON domain-containing protein [Paraburkholderia phenazinium]SIO58741.1 BON domain-containing protein [Paraburkholderia phenazinium]